MAIETLKKITIVVPEESSKRLLRTLNRLGAMEVIDLGEEHREKIPLTRAEWSTEEADEKLRKIDFILNLMNHFAPEEQKFLEGLTPLPLVTSPEEVNKIIKTYNLDETYAYASELDEIYRSSERIIADIENELRELEPLCDLPFSIADFYRPVLTRLLFGTMPLGNISILHEDEDPWDRVAWEVILTGETKEASSSHQGKALPLPERERVWVIFAFLEEDGELVRKSLSALEFEEIQLPRISEKVSDRIEELRSSLAEYVRKVDEVAEKVKLLAQDDTLGDGRRPLRILKAYWQNIKNTHLAYSKGIHGKWVHVVSGFIRERDVDRFLATMKQEFPESEITVVDPGPDDDVPVSISVPRLFQPVKLLVEMFGLPPYRSFDPTPFMQINFYVFFGICFSDVCYGIILTALGIYLSTKTKEFQDVNNFIRILLFGGISSIFFGALTGSWFGDLYKPVYLGEGNLLLLLQEKCVVIDPMNKTIVALLCALGIGVLNQFYALILKMYGALRKKDVMGAFSDGLCWIVTLTGLLMMVGRIFTDVPVHIFNTGLWMFFAGAVGLILTQGRGIQNPLGRLAGGVVSLYGILGSYGITAFIGDTLSYCRLLALGLTTSIVAMAFNLMAGMLREVPYIGVLLFIALLIVGHIFNIAISVLGAFVHSMRLIYVEFFGRFYEVGSRPFQPLGFDSPQCIMRRSEDAVLVRGK